MKNPLTYLNSLFDAFAEKTLSGSDQLICLHIFNKFNRAHWPETVRISDREIQELCRLYDSTGKPVTVKTIRNAKARLKLKGLIDFKAGNGDAPTEYRLNPFHTPGDTPLHPPSHSEPADYIRAREDVKTLDVKTKKIKSAGAREETDPADILKVWKAETGCDLRGDRQRWDLWDKADKNFALTQQAILKAMNTKKTYVLTYEHFQNTYNELQNPVSLKGGDKNARQFDYDKEPDYSWINADS